LRYISLVTHGKKLEGPNPGLSPIGKFQTEQLKPHLPKKPKVIACGTGKRHLDTAQALGLTPTRYSIVIGAPESKNRAKNTVTLADGTEIEYELYTSVADRTDAFVHLVTMLPAGAVVITSRSMVKSIMPFGDSKASAVYRYEPDTKRITEVFAASDDIGEGTMEV